MTGMISSAVRCFSWMICISFSACAGARQARKVARPNSATNKGLIMPATLLQIQTPRLGEVPAPVGVGEAGNVNIFPRGRRVDEPVIAEIQGDMGGFFSFL